MSPRKRRSPPNKRFTEQMKQEMSDDILHHGGTIKKWADFYGVRPQRISKLLNLGLPKGRRPKKSS